VIVLVNKEADSIMSWYKLRENIMYWSFIKYKRVTRSVFASEIYGIINGFNIGIILLLTLKLVIDRVVTV
jgi:hypothetical protein